MHDSPLYTSDIAGGALMLPESRKIARLLITRPSAAEWQEAIFSGNLLQTRSTATAKRYANLIRSRLELSPEPLWHLVAEADQEAATQALFVGAVKHSRLLADFVWDVVGEHHRVLEKKLRPNAWDAFLAICEQRDPSVARWYPSTRQKLRQIVMKILSEVGYVDNTRSLGLRHVILVPKVERHLVAHGENDLVRCLKLIS